MLTIIILAIIGLVIGIFFAVDNYSDGEEPFIGLLVGAVFGLLVSLFIGAAHLDTSTTRSNLANLQDGSSTSGGFFLGTGHIDEKQVFTYYKETDNGKFQLRNLENDTDVFVVQDTKGEAYVETTQTDVNPAWSLWGVGGYIEKTEFHVPKGSIKTDFVLDAKE